MKHIRWSFNVLNNNQITMQHVRLYLTKEFTETQILEISKNEDLLNEYFEYQLTDMDIITGMNLIYNRHDKK